MKTLELALERIPPEDERRRTELLALREEILASRTEAERKAHEAKSKRMCHFAKLPVELATEIFTLVLENDPSRVVLLAAVSRSWRNAILATPALWRNLIVPEKNAVRKITLWRERSRNKLTELSIRGSAQSEYLKDIDQVHSILKGNVSPAQSYFKERMVEAASQLAFEQAQHYKEKLHVLQNFQSKSTVVNPKILDADVFTIASDESAAYINFMKVVNGTITQTNTVEVKKKLDEPDAEELSETILTFLRGFNSALGSHSPIS